MVDGTTEDTEVARVHGGSFGRKEPAGCRRVKPAGRRRYGREIVAKEEAGTEAGLTATTEGGATKGKKRTQRCALENFVSISSIAE